MHRKTAATADRLSVKELMRVTGRQESELAQHRSHEAHMEDSVARLATICAAALSLSSGLRRGQGMSAIAEILVNLVGCENIAIFELKPGASRLELIESVGIEAARFSSVGVGEGLIGQAVASGCLYIKDAGTAPENATAEQNLTACIPLHLAGTVIGAIATFGLLPQKPRLEPVDHEVFALLASLAAPALLGARNA